jgi:hypothetical protein
MSKLIIINLYEQVYNKQLMSKPINVYEQINNKAL